MGGGDFNKWYVCINNKWNPYSEEVRNTPDVYWVVASKFIAMNNKHEWDNLLKPQAELIGNIANPEVYEQYQKEMKKMKDLKGTERGKETKVTNTVAGKKVTTVATEANAHFDPARGLIGEDGNVIIPIEKYQEMTGLTGVAVSY